MFERIIIDVDSLKDCTLVKTFHILSSSSINSINHFQRSCHVPCCTFFTFNILRQEIRPYIKPKIFSSSVGVYLARPTSDYHERERATDLHVKSLDSTLADGVDAARPPFYHSQYNERIARNICLLLCEQPWNK